MADIKISELPVATGPIEDDDILLLVRGGITYQIPGEEHETLGVVSFNSRQGDVFLTSQDVTDALQFFPVQRNSTYSILYGTNSSGQQSLLAYSKSPTALSVAQRTNVNQLQAETVEDDDGQAADSDLVNRAYAQELRLDRVTTVDTAISSTTITSDKDGIIVSGSDVASFAITLPSAITKYKRVLVKFTANITALTIDAGENVGAVANSIDYSPTTANAGDLFEWSYDVTTSTWLITNHISFNSLP